MKHNKHLLLFALLTVFTLSTTAKRISSDDYIFQSGPLENPTLQIGSPQSQTEVTAQEALMKEQLEQLLQRPFFQKTQVGISIYDLTTRQPLFNHGHLQRMRPASTMKVVTAITALAQLGGHYQYSTKVYANGTLNGGVLKGNLYVYGGFNPLFGEEDMMTLVKDLQNKGLKNIQGDIILDYSFKDNEEAGWGWCWDDKNPSLVPLLYKGKANFGNMLNQFLFKKKIRATGNVKYEKVPRSARLLFNLQTPIDSVLKPMMKHSVNQAAESMFYQIGAQSKKPYVDRKVAAKYINQFIDKELHLNSDHYQIADGSGLSLYNYVTPDLLVKLLAYAYQHKEIYDHLYESLPIAGEDGTLKKRMKDTTAEKNVRAKTGTLDGISSLAGYATTANGHQLCFAIINAGQADNDEARDIQDEICRILTE